MISEYDIRKSFLKRLNPKHIFVIILISFLINNYNKTLA